MAACTRLRVRSLTSSGRFRTFDTVPRETPARAATSFMLGAPGPDTAASLRAGGGNVIGLYVTGVRPLTLRNTRPTVRPLPETFHRRTRARALLLPAAGPAGPAPRGPRAPPRPPAGGGPPAA